MKNLESTTVRTALLAELFGAVLLLGACGGGGSDAAAPAPASSTPSPPPETPTSTGATCGISDFAATALARVNAVRATGADCHSRGVFPPAAALTWNAKLTDAASAHSADMAAKNYFSHTSADGRTMDARVNATGYLWSGLGENIAAGYPGIDKVMDGWIASDGHCANLMSANLTEIGLACVPGTSSSTYNTYWTMDLGKPR
jgi:uncharacterized protein YkwD